MTHLHSRASSSPDFGRGCFAFVAHFDATPPTILAPSGPTQKPDTVIPMLPSGWHQVRSLHPVSAFAVPPARMLTLDGAEILVRDAGGTGPPIVLVHGWSADGILNFGSSMGPLYNAGWRPIAIDMPGHGGSRDSSFPGLRRCSDIVAMVMEELEISDAVLAGYSMGGPVSQLVARYRPDLVSGLIQIATGSRNLPSGALRPGARIASGLVSASIAAGHWALRHGQPELNSYGEAGPEKKTSLAAHAAWAYRSVSYRDLCALGLELASYDSRSWVGDLMVPAHCVITRRDLLVEEFAQLELADLLQASRSYIAGGHMALLSSHFPSDVVTAAEDIRNQLRNGPRKSAPLAAPNAA